MGLERERRKGQGPQRGSAGLRTFAITALLGYVALQVGGGLLLGNAAALGSGALSVGGNVTLDGTTGALALANAVNLGSGASLNLLGNQAVTFNGVIGGTGSLVKSGYTFGGWTIGGQTYAAGGSYSLGSNVTATAIWTAVVVNQPAPAPRRGLSNRTGPCPKTEGAHCTSPRTTIEGADCAHCARTEGAPGNLPQQIQTTEPT